MRILYLMHVNWHWIRQRPHVFAEELSRNHEIKLLHFAMYHKDHRSAENSPPFQSSVLWRIPERLLLHGMFFKKINSALLRHQVKTHARRYRPDLIWVTHPVFADALMGDELCPIIYDCMDDHLAFTDVSERSLAPAEACLVKRAKLTIFSSETLALRVKQRSEVVYAEVINNGVAEHLINRRPGIQPSKECMDPVLGYLGTISHWFDWKLVLHLLDEFPALRFIFAGPIENEIPSHPRIQHMGVLTHESIPQFFAKCNALIMPFLVNRLIESVDPVKLYEYISSGLPSIAPKYSETMRFLPWVKLYESTEEAVEILKGALYQHKIDHHQMERKEFLQANSWRTRANKIEQILKCI